MHRLHDATSREDDNGSRARAQSRRGRRVQEHRHWNFMYTRAYTGADKAAFIGQVGLGSASTAGSGYTYLPVAPGTGQAKAT